MTAPHLAPSSLCLPELLSQLQVVVCPFHRWARPQAADCPDTAALQPGPAQAPPSAGSTQPPSFHSHWPSKHNKDNVFSRKPSLPSPELDPVSSRTLGLGAPGVSPSSGPDCKKLPHPSPRLFHRLPPRWPSAHYNRGWGETGVSGPGPERSCVPGNHKVHLAQRLCPSPRQQTRAASQELS